MSWFVFTLGVLATFRLALMLSSEEGPAAIFARMRRKVPAKTNPGRGIRCFKCWTVWISVGMTWLALPWETEPKPCFLYCLALSGAAIALNELLPGKR